ncbi:deacetylase [Thermobispora bispora]|uniref:Polysaccharide deacetylase n=1 Tax=Thermobispora bispora (strain ATCC 19993 / DSM 43833 / CBS 139.67 / JCM 10125 / KCTC 9307 / NBRC 14880 / R51) TaxID=469371 RepID=D6Y5L3_THEBD|nr:polysaccharide deacetylase family protein [Thermobispora bispora]ADG87359.1 polysaccharide deacetylase [Thermobispora bispora DSM 43833]MBX6167643.1 polysaccharide deacetylase family protein [Thermobispora bispora]MDI9582060.1 polysaccharide deacetylase family protein [Thermobispora sp.]
MKSRRLIPLAVALALAAIPAAPAHAGPETAAGSTATEPFCARHKCIALTFDDGPAEYTGTLLKVLKKYNAKATFFMIGNRVRKHPKLAAQVAKAGHEIGNHTYDHKYLTELEYREIYTQVQKAQQIIRKATGKRPVVFRAPGGLYNAGVLDVVGKFGMVQVPGTVATKDYVKDYRKVGLLTRRALEVAGPGEIVLMHETVKETVQSLPAVLERLSKQGYRFVTVSTLMEGEEVTPGQVYPPRPQVVG